MPDASPPPDTAPFHQWTRAGPHHVHARVRADRAPAGRLPVVLVHGQVVASSYLVPTLQQLAPHVPVYAPDLPGYGDSTKPHRALDVEGLADALVAWMDAMELPAAGLVGNSFGCNVVTAAAVRHPHRVARAVLQGPTMDPAARDLPTALWRGIVNARREPSMGGIFREDYRKAGLRRAVATLRLALSDPLEERLPQMGMPTLVVRGDRDLLVPATWADEVVRRLPRGELVTLPGAAHTIVYHQPQGLARAMLPFLLDATREAREVVPR